MDQETCRRQVDALVESSRHYGRGGIIGLYKLLCYIGERYASPVVDVGLRLFMADVFFSSGRTKIANWDSTVMLFEYEYNVPLLSPEVAAYMATAGELVLPVLLLLGLGTRFAAAGLLIMTAVIEFTYQHYDIHLVWALMLATLLMRGGGALSVDYLIDRMCRKRK